MAKNSPESRLLETKAEVMKELGGIHPVAALTGADWKNVETWNRAATFPSRYFLVMFWALRRKRLSAPPELWGMVTPVERKQALSAMVSTQKDRLAS
jgi:hypothetical protein